MAAGKFHTFQLRGRKVPHFISEAIGTMGQCRDCSEFTIFGLIHAASNVKTDITRVIPFESVYNRAEVGKDMPIQADET